MKNRFLVCLMTLGWALVAQAQDKPAAPEKSTGAGRIYKCGNEYTNTITEAQAKTCKLVAGGNVTIVPAQKFVGKASGPAAPRVDSAGQRERDSDARTILEAELKKSESRLAELTKEYNGGEPDKRGDEGRNYQKYLDRVSDLKASIARTEGDIAGIKRELGRLPPAN